MTDCFVHASDLHLDAPLGSLGMLGAERRRDLARRAAGAWDNLVDLCIGRRASFVVLAGDIFHEADAGVAVQLGFHDGLRRLVEAGVPVFICHGNHDPLSEGFRPVGALPEGVIRFEPGEPQAHPVTLRNSGETVLVSGVSFGRRFESENLALHFRAIERPPGVPHVAVLHANVGGNPGHDPYAPCTYDDLATAQVDYWALGHIHKREVVRLPNGARAAYCGNLQGRSFKPAECEPKGALVVPVAGGHLGEPEFLACDAVRFVRSEVEVEPDDSIVDVTDRLLATAREVAAENAPRPVVWEARLTGEMQAARQLDEALSKGELIGEGLEAELSPALAGGGLARLESVVRTPVDRAALLAAGDLFSDVLRRLHHFRPPATPPPDSAAESEDEHSSDDDLRELLLDGLPSALRGVWQDILDERPDRLGDVLAAAEESLLAIAAEAEGSRR